MMRTQDLWFVAWIEVTTQFTFTNYHKVNARKSIFEFEYDMDDKQEKSLKMLYYRSEALKVSETLKTIKKILK